MLREQEDEIHRLQTIVETALSNTTSTVKKTEKNKSILSENEKDEIKVEIILQKNEEMEEMQEEHNLLCVEMNVTMKNLKNENQRLLDEMKEIKILQNIQSEKNNSAIETVVLEEEVDIEKVDSNAQAEDDDNTEKNVIMLQKALEEVKQYANDGAQAAKNEFTTRYVEYININGFVLTSCTLMLLFNI